MSEMENKLASILGDPQMMQQIMSMAQALSASASTPEPPKNSAPETPGIDPALLRSLAGMAQGSQVDENQQHLLAALCPYMSQTKVHKLEKAMRAAKLAGLASGLINSGSLQALLGR